MKKMRDKVLLYNNWILKKLKKKNYWKKYIYKNKSKKSIEN